MFYCQIYDCTDMPIYNQYQAVFFACRAVILAKNRPGDEARLEAMLAMAQCLQCLCFSQCSLQPVSYHTNERSTTRVLEAV